MSEKCRTNNEGESVLLFGRTSEGNGRTPEDKVGENGNKNGGRDEQRKDDLI